MGVFVFKNTQIFGLVFLRYVPSNVPSPHHHVGVCVYMFQFGHFAINLYSHEPSKRSALIHYIEKNEIQQFALQMGCIGLSPVLYTVSQ